MADSVAAITGCSEQEAASYLDMAGGSVEGAVSLFFDMQGGGGGGMMMGMGGGEPASAGAPPSPAHAALFGSAAAPPAWLEQGFEFSTEPESRVGIVQHKNGPCGVLAVVNAAVIAHLGCPLPSAAVDDADLCAALGGILWRCASDGRVVLAKWEGEVGGDVASQEKLCEGAAEVAALLLADAAALKGRGGCCLFCYACVLTRGVDAVKAEAAKDGGGVPLVSGPHALCGTELINLMLAGVARANVGAYDGAGSGGKVAWRPPAGAVGMLSRDELESGVPLADALKSPTAPVYVLHGGDHFTVAWLPAPAAERFQARVKAIFGAAAAAGVPPNEAAATALERAAAEAKEAPAPPPSPAGAFDFALWNGLPPNRALGWLRLRGAGADPRAAAPPAPAQHTPTHWRLTVGEVESIVQASPDDKKRAPGAWREHRYEISLVTKAVADEDVASAPRPADVPPPLTLEQGAAPPPGAAWRCASCYHGRFKTMCFGDNPAPAGVNCKFCGQTQAAAGWTLWRPYAELPTPLKRRVDRMSGPKVLAVLRTRWPDATVAAVKADGSEAELGTAAYGAGSFATPFER